MSDNSVEWDAAFNRIKCFFGFHDYIEIYREKDKPIPRPEMATGCRK